MILLDACAVVNLYASRRMSDILDAVGGTVAIVDRVFREAQYVFRGGTGEDAREREPVDLEPLVALGLLSIWATDNETELLTFIDLTLELDEGEAMTAALAIHRGGTVVTDDRKAIRVLTQRSVPWRRSLELVKVWADRGGLDPNELAHVLADIRVRGSYLPSGNHPLLDWWESALE